MMNVHLPTGQPYFPYGIAIAYTGATHARPALRLRLTVYNFALFEQRPGELFWPCGRH